MLAHLGNKLGVVQEEELDICGLCVGIVSEKSNEHLEHFGEYFGARIGEDLVNLLNDLWGN